MEDLYLIPSAEVRVTNIYAGEILSEDDLLLIRKVGRNKSIYFFDFINMLNNYYVKRNISL